MTSAKSFYICVFDSMSKIFPELFVTRCNMKNYIFEIMTRSGEWGKQCKRPFELLSGLCFHQLWGPSSEYFSISQCKNEISVKIYNYLKLSSRSVTGTFIGILKWFSWIVGLSVDREFIIGYQPPRYHGVEPKATYILTARKRRYTYLDIAVRY